MNQVKNIQIPTAHVTYDMRIERNNHKGIVLWFAGLSGAGKSTLAHLVEKDLFAQGKQIIVLDGDVIRTGLCSDLSFSNAARDENIRRIAELSRLFALQGYICLCAFISPLRKHRKIASEIIKEFYHEVYISCSLEECERRDVKGYYKLARAGKIKNYTGISAPFDVPKKPHLTVSTDIFSRDDCVELIKNYIIKGATLDSSSSNTKGS